MSFIFLFLQLLLRFSLYFDIHQVDSDVSTCVFLCIYTPWGSTAFLDLWVDDFIASVKFPAVISTNIFSCLILFLFSFKDFNYTYIRYCLILSHGSPVFFLSLYLSLDNFYWPILKLFITFADVCILLISTLKEFFTPDIVIFISSISIGSFL